MFVKNSGLGISRYKSLGYHQELFRHLSNDRVLVYGGSNHRPASLSIRRFVHCLTIIARGRTRSSIST